MDERPVVTCFLRDGGVTGEDGHPGLDSVREVSKRYTGNVSVGRGGQRSSSTTGTPASATSAANARESASRFEKVL